MQNEIIEITKYWRYIWRDIFTNGISNSPYSEALFVFLSSLFIKARQTIPCGSILYRARIMSEEDIIESNNRILNNPNTSFKGFDAANSFIPPINNICAGRVNEQFVPCLYAAENYETAQVEVRSKSNDTISIAQIKVNSQILLADTCNLQSNKSGELYYRLLLTRIFSQPVKDKNDYLFSQYAGLLLKRNGFDGIRYASSFIENGHNIAIFNPDKCAPVNSDRYIVEKTNQEPKDIENILGEIYPCLERCITEQFKQM